MGYYDIISKSYSELHEEEQLNKLAIIKANLKVGKNAKLVDVGCGTGISSDFECFVVGVDKSMGMLRQGSKTRVNSCAESLPFKDNTFDYVVSVTSMHNFTDIEKSVKEMKRVGKRDFVFSVLKKSKEFNGIKRHIESSFRIEKVADGEKDAIFFCKNTSFIYRK